MKNVAQAYPNSKNDRTKYLKFAPELVTDFAKMRKFVLDRAEQPDLNDVVRNSGKQIHVLGRDAAMHMVANRVTLCVIHFFKYFQGRHQMSRGRGEAVFCVCPSTRNAKHHPRS